ncbi:uncharacterized protein M6B38_159135 [Iris pallida]|uniref:DUF3741 domain-containing protein n=1 Tax=Iris pallida TaxID=29817 RepID=A0AAX6F2G8_IRIPA|nr:uncharacterized protein M6B38_159135 [Iris pallida]
MLRDSLRSAVYRSLTKPLPLKKDNLVDHETNGTSRSSGPAELNSPSRGGARGLMEEEEEEEEEGQLRLFRASEGARELTRMINSLSGGPHLDGRSKHVAGDLLEGARGLQSSLAALAKRQEAPKRRTELAEDEKSGAGGTMAPKRFRSRKPDFSADGSSRYGSEEAKRVSWMEYMEEEIGVHDDGVSRRTSTFKLEFMTRLLTGTNRELRRAVADSLCRQSSPPPGPPEAPVAAATLRPRQVRGPNVVARLMGLDEEERKKSLRGAPRPAFDIDDRPKARKAQTPPERPDPTGRGTLLHEIAAAVQFSGLLGGGRGDASRFEKLGRSFREEEDAPPPIVIMKPLCKPHWEREEGRRSLLPADSTAEEAKRKKKASKSIKRTEEERKLLLDVKKEVEEEKEGRRKKEKKNSKAKSVRKSTDTNTKDDERNNPDHEGIDSSSTSRIRTSTARDQDGKTQKTNRAGRAASELEEDLMCLLLSSRSFIDRAKELFRIDARQPARHVRRKGVGEDVMRNAKLYLDCGKELMARSLTGCGGSLGQLAEEVSRGIEVLTSCGESEGDLYGRLERDLGGKEMMASANWDTGWDTSVGTEDATRVVDELEELVTSWLIAEVSQDLVWL